MSKPATTLASLGTDVRDIARRLVSPPGVSFDQFYELAKEAVVEKHEAGAKLFEKGTSDNRVMYLLSGEVDLIGGPEGQECISASGAKGKHPLADSQPRSCTARSRSAVSVLIFDRRRIARPEEEAGGIDVCDFSIEIDGDADENDPVEDHSDDTWMTRILQSTLSESIPPAKLHGLFQRLQERHAKHGEVIIRQGDKPDFYYLIKRGQCRVTRENSSGARVTLAVLESGEVFGEEALVTGGERGATVTMETDGVLMRLNGKDFAEFLLYPLLEEIPMSEAVEIVGRGGAFLDVRSLDDPCQGQIPGSLHMPLYLLRASIAQLDREREYVCYCATGALSRATAFVLRTWGFRSYSLRGGIASAGDHSALTDRAAASAAPTPPAPAISTPRGSATG